ncbi:MAG: cytochrome c [Acidobacteriota bacterium]|nr:MAG: cytochrome c [Acidobacteriota bacterium]
MRLTPSLFALLALFVGAAACAGGTSQEPPAVDLSNVPRWDVPLDVPDEEKSRVNPIPSDPESLEQGRVLFNSQCSMCHGEAGDGTGDLVARLDLQMPDLTEAQLQEARSDGEWYFVIAFGHGRMPGDESSKFTDKWKWDLVNHMRALRDRASDERLPAGA